MPFDLPSDDMLYSALLARDPAFEGFAFVGVTSTGIFCRLTCPARNPKRENTVFFSTVAEAMEGGFRPCRRCRPLHAGRVASEPVVDDLLAALDEAPRRRWTEDEIVRRGHDPSTARRAFKRRFGMTFLDMARLRRLGRGVAKLAKGEAVIDAQPEAGFGSGSGFRQAVETMLGESPAGVRGSPLLHADFLETPIGLTVAIAGDIELHLLEFLERKALPAELRRLQATMRLGFTRGRTPPIDQVDAELNSYFAGRSADFAVPLAGAASAFARAVRQALRQIPAGETRSYGELARTLGRPTASRAVAGANGANPLAIVVPCHRVIGADGSLTGYGGGLWRKRWLLEHERRSFPPPAGECGRQGSSSASA